MGICDGFEKSLCGILKQLLRILKRLLFNAQIHKQLCKSIGGISMLDKKDEFKQARTFQRVAEIPIPKTFNDLTRMDFVDYGDRQQFSIYKLLFRVIR